MSILALSLVYAIVRTTEGREARPVLRGAKPWTRDPILLENMVFTILKLLIHVKLKPYQGLYGSQSTTIGFGDNSRSLMIESAGWQLAETEN